MTSGADVLLDLSCRAHTCSGGIVQVLFDPFLVTRCHVTIFRNSERLEGTPGNPATLTRSNSTGNPVPKRSETSRVTGSQARWLGAASPVTRIQAGGAPSAGEGRCF